jgi:hypothetical protein
MLQWSTIASRTAKIVEDGLGAPQNAPLWRDCCIALNRALAAVSGSDVLRAHGDRLRELDPAFLADLRAFCTCMCHLSFVAGATSMGLRDRASVLEYMHGHLPDLAGNPDMERLMGVAKSACRADACLYMASHLRHEGTDVVSAVACVQEALRE